METPLLWTEEQRSQLLRGSLVAEQSRERERELRDEWASLSSDSPDLSPGACETHSEWRLNFYSIVICIISIFAVSVCVSQERHTWQTRRKEQYVISRIEHLENRLRQILKGRLREILTQVLPPHCSEGLHRRITRWVCSLLLRGAGG